MTTKNKHTADRLYQAAVTLCGALVWLWALARLQAGYAPTEQVIVLGLVPLMVCVGHFTQVFRLPLGVSLTEERLAVSFSDAIILLVACGYGVAPAVFVAGLEGFITSRRGVRKFSSNAFSFSMMSLAAAAGGAGLQGVLRAGAAPGQEPAFQVVAVGLIAGSVLHNFSNMWLLSTLLSLRHARPLVAAWKESVLWAAPILCLPTGVAALLMYLALGHGVWTLAAIAVPTLLAIGLAQRQNRRAVEQQIEAVEKAHRETIEALAVAINAKDKVTHGHVLRVQVYAAGVARLLGCTEAEIEALRAGALLHDIGKIAVPDYILNKPGKLTAEEFEQMKAHTLVGAQILGRVDFPYPVAPVVRHHHERWDGKGYPDGLSGEEIPLTARILSIVDCFDAVREDRQYRRGLTREEAIALIMEGSGTQYDPRVVGTFVTHLPAFEAEIQATRGRPLPTFGIEAPEQLTAAASGVAPAAGLAAETEPSEAQLSEEDLRALDELAAALERARPEPAAVAQAFCDALSRFAPYDTAAVTLAHAGGGYAVAHAAGAHAALLRGRPVRQNDGVTGWVLANQQPFCNAAPALDFPADLAAHFAGYRALAAFPVTHGETTHGAVTLYAVALAEYTPAQRLRLAAAAAVLATALSPAEHATPHFAIEQPLRHCGDAPAPTHAPAPVESELTH